MHRPQRAAARTIQPGRHVKVTYRIKAMLGRIEEKQNSCDAHCCKQDQGNNGGITVTLLLQFGRKTLGVQWISLGCGIHEMKRAQWNALFTSGFASTTSAQMPMGNPTRQQGEMQGASARMLAVIAHP